MNWLLFALAAVMAFCTLCYVASVGEPREPITPGDATMAVVVYGGIITLVVLAGLRLTA